MSSGFMPCRALADIRNTLLAYDLHHIPSGGGVCVILYKGFSVTVNPTTKYKSFEYVDLTVATPGTPAVKFFIIILSTTLF